jgi:RNA polymerase sigma-70 factor, ECF subfamily
VASATLSAEPRVADPTSADGVAIVRLRAGDLRAIDALYDAHAARLLALATRLCGSRADAEDVVHDVFVALPRAVRSYEERGQLGAWLARLVTNRVLDRRRATLRRRELPLEAAGDAAAAAGELDVADARLERAIAARPEPLRVVFVLRAVEGHTHPEIARLLGIRAGTSEVRYFRAVRALRAVLGDRP